MSEDEVVDHDIVARASIAFREQHADARNRVPGARGESSGGKPKLNSERQEQNKRPRGRCDVGARGQKRTDTQEGGIEGIRSR